MRLLAPLLLLLLSGCLVAPSPVVVAPTPVPEPPLPAVGGRIAFLSDRSGHRELWVVNPDGTGATALLPGLTMDIAPVWAPDGSRLAYGVNESGKTLLGIITVNADNSPGANGILTTEPRDSDNTSPAWSPDGSQIAFQSNRSGSYQIYTIPAAGGPVTAYPGQPARATAPAWSPDGKTLVFAGGADAEHMELWTVSVASGAPVQLTNNGRSAARPTWAPDGKTIVFLFGTANGTQNIAEIRPDGTGQREMVTGGENRALVLSPDGAWIAYHANPTKDNDIYVLARAAAGATNLTHDPVGDISPAWAPDGSRLAFASSRTGAYRLYTVARDGTHLTPLTSGPGDYSDTFPTWSAVP
ncbi:MAG TPA: LpqB family beta-propeller domain-containing protein [Chloroflexia bacterium]|nr:LpqB family beta-propeller domain-containing protein [Chloroflexia bacterium]